MRETPLATSSPAPALAGGADTFDWQRLDGGPLILRCGAASLAFALDWRPLLGRQTVQQHRRRARALRASHYVCSGEAAASMACVRLPRRWRDRHSLYAVALLVAARCGNGTQAWRLDLGAHGVWLLAVHDGAVIAGTDCCHASAAQADQALQALHQRYPGLRTCQLAPSLAELCRMLDEPSSISAARLHALPRRAWRSVTGCALALLGFVWWQRQAPTAPPVAAPVVLEPAQRWAAAYDDFGLQRRLHDSAALRSLLSAVAGLPLRRQGWALERAECVANLAGWRCRATYRRVVRVADYDGISHRWPSSWQVEYSGFDMARVAWQVHGGRPMDWRLLGRSAQLLAGPVAQWQRQGPLYEALNLGEARAVSLVVPSDADGMPLPRPASVPALWQRTVTVSAALRHLPVLQDVHWPISWERLTLEVRSSDILPQAGGTRLLAHLEGVLYAKD